MSAKISVGVLVGPGKLGKLVHGDGGPRLETMIKANHDVGTDLFFFSLDDVNPNTRQIKGIFKTDGGKWLDKVFPYPQAFYKRLTIPEADRPRFVRLLGQLRVQGTVFLNYQHQVDKWEVYQCLCGEPELVNYLPQTWSVQTDGDILALFNSYKVLYLKARSGGRGKQVMRVEKLPHDNYRLSRFNNGLTRGKLHWGGLCQEIQSFFGNKPIIAQEAIDLIQVDRCNVDFRAEMLRDGAGKIKVVGIPVRIARESSPITTHSISMSLEKFSELYPSLLPDCEGFNVRAGEILKQVYWRIEECYGPCGELGIDFALDRAGNLLFIEANAQSAKVSLFNSYPAESVTQSFTDLLEYAIHRVQKR